MSRVARIRRTCRTEQFTRLAICVERRVGSCACQYATAAAVCDSSVASLAVSSSADGGGDRSMGAGGGATGSWSGSGGVVGFGAVMGPSAAAVMMPAVCTCGTALWWSTTGSGLEAEVDAYLAELDSLNMQVDSHVTGLLHSNQSDSGTSLVAKFTAWQADFGVIRRKLNELNQDVHGMLNNAMKARTAASQYAARAAEPQSTL